VKLGVAIKLNLRLKTSTLKRQLIILRLIYLQVIKDNKIQVRAKHEEKTSERLSKSKFSKEYELTEKIETYSLTGGLASDGRLIVGAFAKGHGEGSFSKPGSSSSSSAAAAGATTTAASGTVNGNGSGNSVNGTDSEQGGASASASDGNATTTASVVDEETGQQKSVPVEPCEVRPTTT
jgi:hypothetical protein